MIPPAIGRTPGSASPSRGWLALLAILAITLPSLVLGIDVRLTTNSMENRALVTSQETWLRLKSGEAATWLVSTNEGEPRLEKPPMLMWLNLLAWSDLDPATAKPQELIHRARCVSVALGLLMLAGVFLMARMLGDVRFAALATLVVGSSFFWQRQARMASYDMHYVAWMTLAVALGLWAMRPLHAAPPSLARRAIGWGGCAFALCAAAMSKNPLPYLFALPVLIGAIVMLVPRGRKRIDALWLTGAALLSAVPVALWYGYVLRTWPNLAGHVLQREMSQPRPVYLPVYYYLGLFGLIVPWSIWLVGGLIEPFKMKNPAYRRAAMLMLLWFGMIFVAVSIPAAKQQRYILGIMPACGLLVGMFMRQHDERAAGLPPCSDRFFNALTSGLWIVLTMATFAAVWFLAANEQFMDMARRWIHVPPTIVASIGWPVALMLGVALLTVCALGWRWRVAHPWKSAIALAGWMMIAMPVLWKQMSLIPSLRIQDAVVESARIRAIVGDAPLGTFRWDRSDMERRISQEFRIYYGRLIPRVQPNHLEAWLGQSNREAFILARPLGHITAFLRQHDFELIDEARLDADDVEQLWRWRRPAG